MKILFIVPLNESYETIVGIDKNLQREKFEKSGIKKINVDMPQGVMSIAAYLKSKNKQVEVKVINLNPVLRDLADTKEVNFDKFSLKDFLNYSLELLHGFAPDVVGISVAFATTYKDLPIVTDNIRKKYANATIVTGGHLANSIPKDVLIHCDNCDAISLGEGEIPFLRLAEMQGETSGRRANIIEYLDQADAWLSRNNLKDNQAIANKMESAIPMMELDDIPPYDLNCLVGKGHESLPFTYSSSFGYSEKERKSTYIMTTRGCPYDCIFCAAQGVHGHKLRKQSVEKVKNDLLYYNEKFGITTFIIADDNFLLDGQRACQILDFMKERGFEVAFINLALQFIDEEIARRLHEHKISSVTISIESGNPETRAKIVGKKYTNEQIVGVCDLLHNYNIRVGSNIVIGIPGESKDSINEGIEQLLRFPVDWYSIYVAAPLPGSRLYNICKENNFLYRPFEDSMDFKHACIKTPEFEPQYIENIVYEANLRLNYVNNYNIKIGEYEIALGQFEGVIERALETHALAHYFAAICCKELGQKNSKYEAKYEYYKKQYEKNIKEYNFWGEWAKHFALEELK